MTEITQEMRDSIKEKCVELRVVGNVIKAYKYGSKRVPGKKWPQKVYKETLGIFDTVTMTINKTSTKIDTPIINHLSYGAYNLINKVSLDVYDILKKFYDIKTATQIYVIAMIRLISKYNVFTALDMEYNNSTLCITYPNVGLSKNTISDLLNHLGKTRTTSIEMMKSLITNTDVLVIDGTHIFNDSYTNGISKVGVDKGSFQKQISLLYGFDPITNAPIMFKEYRGNITDKTAFDDFQEWFNLDKSIVILDKGFNKKKTLKELSLGNVRFIIPTNNNSKIVKSNFDFKFSKQFYYNELETIVYYEKVKIDDNTFIYSFQNNTMRTNKENFYAKKGIEAKKSEILGVISFVSNLDIEESKLYDYYQKRWKIETMFSDLKKILGFSTVQVSGSERVYGALLINHVSMMIYYRLLNHLNKHSDLLKNQSTKRLLHQLSYIHKCLNGKKWTIDKVTLKDYKFYKELGIDMEN